MISSVSKISKVIIEKTLGIKSVNIPYVNSLQAMAKNLNEENLKQMLLKQNTQANQVVGSVNGELERKY